MTMPNERTRSVIQTGEFLHELSKSQLIPESLRQEAKRLLRHYPEPWMVLSAGRFEEMIHSAEPGDPQRELAISLYPAMFSSSIDS